MTKMKRIESDKTCILYRNRDVYIWHLAKLVLLLLLGNIAM